jgi:hypothetical protein
MKNVHLEKLLESSITVFLNIGRFNWFLSRQSGTLRQNMLQIGYKDAIATQ